VAPGTKVRLTGVVRGLHGVVVQARSSGQAWQQLRTITPAARTGRFHFSVRPKVTTKYRLATAQDAAAYVRIRVQ
jgi:RecB family exonuclease